jgi:hypothetical protein
MPMSCEVTGMQRARTGDDVTVLGARHAGTATLLRCVAPMR